MESIYASKKTLLISLLSTTVFAAVISFFPQYYGYLLIAYFIIMPAIMIKYMSKQIKQMRVPSGGKVIMVEDARELFDKDPQGDEIMKAQMKQNMLGMMPLLVLIGLGLTLWPLIEHVPNPWIRFAAIFAYFESYSIMNYFLSKKMMSMSKYVLKPVFQYKVTDKGIQIKPFGSISFPLRDYEIRLVKESSAVDLISKKDGQQSYRIYSKDPEKLFNILRDKGLAEA